MRSPASDRIVIGVLIALAFSSVGAKAWVGPPKDGLIRSHPGQLERQLVRMLELQGFDQRPHIQNLKFDRLRDARRMSPKR